MTEFPDRAVAGIHRTYQHTCFAANAPRFVHVIPKIFELCYILEVIINWFKRLRKIVKGD